MGSPTPEPRSHTPWVKIGLWLVIATMGYNLIEAMIALWAGIKAQSIALVGFGLDSVIEMIAATVLLWRLYVEAKGTEAEEIEVAEHRVHRVVGITFIVLAAYVGIQSIWTLLSRSAPAESTLGIILAGVSLIIMPLVALGKLQAAKHIGSRALQAEAKETLACSYLSFCLLLGLSVNAIWGWWWADPVAALFLIPFFIKEGLEAFSDDD